MLLVFAFWRQSKVISGTVSGKMTVMWPSNFDLIGTKLVYFKFLASPETNFLYLKLANTTTIRGDWKISDHCARSKRSDLVVID